MSLSVTGLPGWLSLLAIMLMLLVTIAYLVIPFTVLGHGARLQDIEDQIDRLRFDVRELTVVVAELAQRDALAGAAREGGAEVHRLVPASRAARRRA